MDALIMRNKIQNMLPLHLPWTFRLLSTHDRSLIQHFLDEMQDFFLLCEGKKGTAEDLLNACPEGKDPIVDKYVLGLFEGDMLIGLADIIKDYPAPNTWTIGYLLIHPKYREQNKGSIFVEEMKMFQHHGAKILRCIVQKQNSKALSFWKKNGFILDQTSEQVLGTHTNHIYILEKNL